MAEPRNRAIGSFTTDEIKRLDALRLEEVPRSKRKGPNGETTRWESRRECVARLVAAEEMRRGTALMELLDLSG